MSEIFKKAAWIKVPGYENEKYGFAWDVPQGVQKNEHMVPKSGMPLFRKSFIIKGKEIKSAVLYSTALGVYDLFINGKRAGVRLSDGSMRYDELKPGWSDYRKRVLYYTYDITDSITQGDNAIAALVTPGWWGGRISMGTYDSKALAFMAVIFVIYTDGTSQEICTDESWKAIVGGPVLNADIWDGEFYDSRKVVPGWDIAGFDDSSWLNAELCQNDVEITPQIGPAIRVRENLSLHPENITVFGGIKDNGSEYGEIDIIKEYSSFHDKSQKVSVFNSPIKLKVGQTAVFDMSQNLVGWPDITVKGAAGTKITMLFGEMLNDSGEESRGNDGPKGTVYTQNLRTAKSKTYYILNGAGEGENYHPRFTFFGFRYIQMIADGDIEIISLHTEVVGSDTKETGSIVTSNDEVNKLFSNILWGQRSNYLSTTTDCPQRDERLGWTGDTQIFSNAAAYNADVREFFHKWLQDMRDSQFESGAYPDVVPYVRNFRAGNTGWADVGIIVPYVIYTMYNDRDIIRECYASMEKYMAYLSGFGYEGSENLYGDWLSYEKTDKSIISVAYYAYDALLMSRMSSALAVSDNMYTEKAVKYLNLYNCIKAFFQGRFINKKGYLSVNSQTAYLLALKVNLIPEKYKEKCIKALVKKIKDNNYTLSTGFIGTGILNQTLSEIGETNLAYSLLLQTACPSWLYSVRQGATTIWERWNSYTLDKGFGNVSMNSFNHYAYGAVAEWMYRYMAGISPDEVRPGFEHIILQPRPDTRTAEELPGGQTNITWVKASYETRFGRIVSNWSREGDSFVYEFEIPNGTTAELRLPGKEAVELKPGKYSFR